MSDYMPDTEEIRNMYASPSWVTAAQEAERYGEFDAWLKEIRADAWDEAADHLTQGITVDDAHMIGIAEELQQENPYRQENQ